MACCCCCCCCCCPFCNHVCLPHFFFLFCFFAFGNKDGDVGEPKSVTVVKFSTAFVPSELEWAIMRAGDTPAPDAYQSKISKGLGGSSVSLFLFIVIFCLVWFLSGTSFVPDTTQLFFSLSCLNMIYVCCRFNNRVLRKLEIHKAKVNWIGSWQDRPACQDHMII